MDMIAKLHSLFSVEGPHNEYWRKCFEGQFHYLTSQLTTPKHKIGVQLGIFTQDSNMLCTLEERRLPWFLQKVRLGLVSYGPLKKLYFLFYGRLDLFEFDLNLWTWQDKNPFN